MFIAWYYMKFLHLRRGDKLFEINFELLSKNPLAPLPPPSSSLFLMDNISCMKCQPRLNEKYKPVLHCISSSKITSVKSYKIQLAAFLFLVLHQYLYQQIPFLQLTRISFNIIWKRLFSQILLFQQIPPPSPQPHPLNGQNLLNVTKVFLSIFPKMPSDLFFFSKM